jgi:hypothetical protein
MGGLALKNTFTRRFQKDEYLKLESLVFDILKEDFVQFDTPLYYSDKSSFGDMDIILSMEGFNKPMREYIKETFGVTDNEMFHNGNCWSFAFHELQIDLITCAPEDFSSNYHYLAFNDLGNFIGRLAHAKGVKYGQEGLWYNHYFKDGKIGKVMISKDYDDIFEFLGLSYSDWKNGFKTLEEIFEYVATSEFFDGDMFQLSNLPSPDSNV